MPPLEDIVSEVEAVTSRSVKIKPFLLPPDLVDMFLASGWQQPQVYLDPAVRAGMSIFRFSDTSGVKQGLERLRSDLEDGRWEKQYGQLRSLHEIDAGYRFLRVFT